jgi:outer membrane receptor protein involved in Fe transport
LHSVKRAFSFWRVSEPNFSQFKWFLRENCMHFRSRIAVGVLVLAILALIGLPAVSTAQSSKGTLVGAVTDPTGAAVPGADVKVISAQYGAPREATTDGVGTYRLEDLQPGTYKVTVTATGFSVLEIGNVIVQGSVTTTANASLQLGASSTSISVEAGANQTIDTQSGQLSESLGQNEIQNLPNNSFNAAYLALTLPGVQDTPGYTSGTGAVNAYLTNGVSFSVNGTRPRANDFMIDGMNDNDSEITGQAFQPDNVSLISEVSFLTNAYGAEFGWGGGSVTNYITKSGSNSFHGEAWEINQDSAFASNDAQNKFIGNPTTPLYVQNTFGVSLGGPIKRDKLFFFGTAQWDPQRQRATGQSFAIPDANGIATLTTLAATNPRAQIFLNSLGGLVAPGSHTCGSLPQFDETAPGPGLPCVEMNIFARTNVPLVGTDDNWNIRGDWQPTTKDQISGSYLHSYSSLSPDFFANNGALPPFDSYQSGPASIVRAHWQRTFSPTLLNEVRFSYSSINFTFGYPPSVLSGPLASLPYLQFPTLPIPNFGLNDSFPQGRGHNTYQIQDKLTYSLGRHTLTAGFDLDREIDRDVNSLNTRGSVTYEAGGGFDPFGNFLEDFTGTSGSIDRTFGNPILNPKLTMIAPYFQDTWRVKDNLTFTMGLRYENWGTPENVLTFPAFNSALGFGIPTATAADYPGIFALKQKADNNNFAPRFSFAYTPHWGRRWFGNDLTVIRGGYGVFYDGFFTNIPDNAAVGPPNATGGTITGGAGQGAPNALESVAAITPGVADPQAFVSTVNYNIVNPVTQQWNVDVERSLPGKFVLTTSYVGTRGTHLYANVDYNPTVNYGPRMNPNFGEIGSRTNAGDSWYNAGELELERKVNTSLTLRASYTYSKFLDDASEIFTTTGTSSYAQILNCQKCDWGPSTFDRRHRFVASYVWAMPYLKESWIERALTDQWQWSGIATFETGTPNNVVVGQDNIGNGHAGSRPNLSNPKQPITAIGIDSGWWGTPGGTTFVINAHCIADSDPFLDPTHCVAKPASDFRFIVPADGPGNLGRDSVFGPGQVFFDTSLQRNFPLHIGKLENQSLMFRAEFFNAFNHPNLYTPSYTMFAGNYDDTAATIEGQRVIKFWLKYSF